jgi:YidC/Oxa1 family membrane protein insertase
MYNSGMYELWNTFLYQPFYNVLIWLTSVMPFGDVGLAVIALTIIVKLILYPLTKKTIKSQLDMKRLEPELARIKKEYPNKEEQAKKTFELYKTSETNPFAGCLVMIIQIPIILALYYVFYIGFAASNAVPLYSFVTMPENLNTMFLGLIDITKPNIVLALLAGISQFIQMRVSFGSAKTETGDVSSQQQMMQSMQKQMQYVFPVIIAVIGFQLSGAVALYWITSNIVGAIQEYRIRKAYDLKKAA